VKAPSKLPPSDQDVGALESAAAAVTGEALQQALEALREEVRGWLDALHANVTGGLQQKADQDKVGEIARRVLQAAATADGAVALIAKRPLLGKCASCDVPFGGDICCERRPQSQTVQASSHPRTSPGVQVTMRPPDARRLMVPQGQPLQSVPRDKLPRISDSQSSKDFPKGRVLRNSSTPELRPRPEFPSGE